MDLNKQTKIRKLIFTQLQSIFSFIKQQPTQMINKVAQTVSAQARLAKNLYSSLVYGFAEEGGQGGRKDFMGRGGDQKKQVKIDEKYKIKSAALYDKYLISRQKPTISLDEYQINYCWILQRIPIFIPYNKHEFSFYKNRYQIGKKTGYFVPLPKDLIIEQGDYLFEEYEKSNPENIPSHETTVNGETVFYRENARYWRYTDPNITDDKSVQAYSSDNVFFIVQNSQGEWIFPQRPISQKETHEDFFKGFAAELFGGEAYPNIYFGDKKPNYIGKQQIENMEKGKGIKTFYYKGFSMSGIPKFPTGLFKDFKWVPKPHLHKFFTPDYCKRVVRLAEFSF